MEQTSNNIEMAPVTCEDPVLKDGFCAIPMSLMDDDRVTNGAAVTYGLIYYYYAKYHGFPGVELIAAQMGVSERSVGTYMGELKKAGYIDVKQRGMGKKAMVILKKLPENTPSRTAKFASQVGSTLPTLPGSTLPTLKAVRQSNDVRERPCVTANAVPLANDVQNLQTTGGTQRKLTDVQQAIQDAFNAFPIEGVATDPPGAKRKQYSRLTQVISEYGLTVLRQWTKWLREHPQVVDEAADPWLFFCGKMVDAMKNPWKWQGRANGNGVAAQPPRKSTGDELLDQFIAEHGERPVNVEATPLNPYPCANWDIAWRETEVAAGRDLVIQGGIWHGCTFSELRAHLGEEEAKPYCH